MHNRRSSCSLMLVYKTVLILFNETENKTYGYNNKYWICESFQLPLCLIRFSFFVRNLYGCKKNMLQEPIHAHSSIIHCP